METLSALLALLSGIHGSPVDLPHRRPVMRCFGGGGSFFFSQSGLMNKQSSCRWWDAVMLDYTCSHKYRGQWVKPVSQISPSKELMRLQSHLATNCCELSRYLINKTEEPEMYSDPEARCCIWYSADNRSSNKQSDSWSRHDTETFLRTSPLWGESVDSPMKGQVMWALVFSVALARTNRWRKGRDAANLRRHGSRVTSL